MAVDTSALMAIILRERTAAACAAALRSDAQRLISAGTVAETLIVAEKRGIFDEMVRLVDGLQFEIASVTAASARRIAEAHRRFGKGKHRLNFGDCFAYELAISRNCPLLYIGSDFARTDVQSVL